MRFIDNIVFLKNKMHSVDMKYAYKVVNNRNEIIEVVKTTFVSF